MRRLQRLVERVATGVSGALMAVIMGILIYNVFARFLLPVCGVLSALSAGLDLLVRLRWGDAAGEHEDEKEVPG